MTKDIMLDLETLSLDANAVIVSIGAVAFDLHTGIVGDKFHITIDILEQTLHGGDISKDTLSWWTSQDAEAKLALIAKGHSAVSVPHAMDTLHNWI